MSNLMFMSPPPIHHANPTKRSTRAPFGRPGRPASSSLHEPNFFSRYYAHCPLAQSAADRPSNRRRRSGLPNGYGREHGGPDERPAQRTARTVDVETRCSESGSPARIPPAQRAVHPVVEGSGQRAPESSRELRDDTEGKLLVAPICHHTPGQDLGIAYRVASTAGVDRLVTTTSNSGDTHTYTRASTSDGI